MTAEYLIEQCKLANNQTLKEVLVGIMNEYAKRFCDMYDFQEGWWVADDVLGVYCTDDIEVSIGASELVFCVDNDIDGDTFGEWWQYILEQTENPHPINLRSWCNGVRPEMIDDSLGNIVSDPTKLSQFDKYKECEINKPFIPLPIVGEDEPYVFDLNKEPDWTVKVDLSRCTPQQLRFISAMGGCVGDEMKLRVSESIIKSVTEFMDKQLERLRNDTH